MLIDTGETAMDKDLKDLVDEKKIAELATSKDAQEAFFGKNGLIKDLIKSTLETALKAEMAHHLGSR
jgi:transposase-like protein